jgi:L-2,4-diaminobutyrate decarboxylase
MPEPGEVEDDFVADPVGLREALDLLLEARAGPGSPHPESSIDVLSLKWPQSGIGGRAALRALAPVSLNQAVRLDHPGFLAHMDPPTPWMTWAAAMWAAAMNQNVLHPDVGPAARELEKLVIDWLAPAFGMGGGHLVPGSTVANLTALWAARELTGARRVVCSAAAHLSIRKSAHLLGLELVEVPVDAAQRLNVDLLDDDLTDAIVVLVAGTVAAGAIDPLSAGGGAAWRHVDAAWAGPLRLSSHADLLEGIQTADSVAVSAHKWLYQPKGCAAVLFRDPDSALAPLTFGGGYLAAPNVGLLGSAGDRALPLAATLLGWGRKGVAARIDADMALAGRLAEIISAAEDLELWREPVTGVVNWRPRRSPAVQIRMRLDGAWVSTAAIGDEIWLRSVCVNPHADPEVVVEEVRRAARAG